MNKKVIGLDLSLTGTGWFVIDNDKVEYGQLKTTPKKFPNIIERVEYIANFIVNKIKEHNGVDLVIMEDYFVGQNCQTVIQLAVLGTIVRYILLENGIGFLAVMPTQIKKFETGSGNAHKDNMLKSVYKNHGFDIESNNTADACATAYLGEAYLRFLDGESDFLKYQIEVLKKIKKEREIIQPYKNGKDKKDEN